MCVFVWGGAYLLVGGFVVVLLGVFCCLFLVLPFFYLYT